MAFGRDATLTKRCVTRRPRSDKDTAGVVDIDLEAFFDRVNHDRLMVRVRQHVDAPDVLKLINRFLKGGVQVEGQTQTTMKVFRKEAPCRRYWLTWCWTNWTGHWSAKVAASPVMPMTAISLSKANERASGLCTA